MSASSTPRGRRAGPQPHQAVLAAARQSFPVGGEGKSGNDPAWPSSVNIGGSFRRLGTGTGRRDGNKVTVYGSIKARVRALSLLLIG